MNPPIKWKAVVYLLGGSILMLASFTVENPSGYWAMDSAGYLLLILGIGEVIDSLTEKRK